jgi:hypothetical protein
MERHGRTDAARTIGSGNAMNPVLKLAAAGLACVSLAAPAGAACLNPAIAKAAHVGEMEAVLMAGQARCARTGAGFTADFAAFRAASTAAFADAGVRLGQSRFQRVVQAKTADDAELSCADLRLLARTAADSDTLDGLARVAEAFGIESPSKAEPCAPADGGLQIAARP